MLDVQGIQSNHRQTRVWACVQRCCHGVSPCVLTVQRPCTYARSCCQLASRKNVHNTSAHTHMSCLPLYAKSSCNCLPSCNMLCTCPQVDRVMESPGLQKALNGMDQQLTWLQQHPQGKVLWDLGSKLVRGANEQAGGGGQEAQQVTAEELRCGLTSLQVIEAAEMDPCKFLATPAWHTLAGELLPLGSSASWNDRLAFVVAAGSILSVRGQRRQQPGGSGGEVCLQRLLRQLQQLAGDPSPGVRGTVAAVASALVSRCPSGMQDFCMGVADSSMDSGNSAGSPSTASPSKDPAAGGAASSPGRVCSAGGLSSLASSGILSTPSTALAVLQELQALLQRDPCVSVAEAAQSQDSGGSAGGICSDDAGLAAAAAAAADAALLVQGAAPAGAATQGVAEAADLL